MADNLKNGHQTQQNGDYSNNNNNDPSDSDDSDDSDVNSLSGDPPINMNGYIIPTNTNNNDNVANNTDNDNDNTSITKPNKSQPQPQSQSQSQQPQQNGYVKPQPKAQPQPQPKPKPKPKPQAKLNANDDQKIDKNIGKPQQTEIDVVIETLRNLKKSVNHGCINISSDTVEKICLQTRAILNSETALLEIDAPMKIVGDIHGQYFDLLRLFELGGYPNELDNRYIFLGDYVDRGSHSLEVILLLFSYKIKYKNDFYLLRGNHECGSINRIYGFFDECKRRYPDGGIKLWKTFTDVFNYLPVAAIIDEKIFCMHGGLSPQIMKRGSLQQIANIKRPTDVPDRGLLCDLLWADPDIYIDTWGPNDRGVSYTFGQAVLNQFLNVHDMDLICRAHQVVEDGYEFFGQRTLVTIFSAPNYCNEFDNAGAMMSVDDTLMCSFHVLKPNYKKRTRFYQ